MTPEQIERFIDRSARARRLEYAINGMAGRYGDAIYESAMGRTVADIDRATRARFRRHAALMRLTRALAELAVTR